MYGNQSEAEDHKKLALPNPLDDAELAKFKARAKCRHEAVNGRFHNFSALQQTYRHAQDKHEFVFTSIAVMVQKQMDMGNKLFDV